MPSSNHPSDRVNVVEYYRNYSPPFDASKSVRELLRHVPDKYLLGLHGVTLTNSQSTRRLRRGKIRSQKRKVNLADCKGLYRSGQVTLLVDKISPGESDLLLRLSIFRTFF